MRRASHKSAAWKLLEEIAPDVALLQEVNAVPDRIAKEYDVVTKLAAGSQFGTSQRFSTAILVRGSIGASISLTTKWDWVNCELEHFSGNLPAHEVAVRGRVFRVISVYSPAWPVDPARLTSVDVAPVKLELNPKVWVTELLWAAIHDRCGQDGIPWIIGGDFNSSETFDYMWGPKPRGNKEILDRMADLRLIECLRHTSGQLVPTFRSPRGGQVIHQMDHLFVSDQLANDLAACSIVDHARVFGESLSDHLPIIADFSDTPGE